MPQASQATSSRSPGEHTGSSPRARTNHEPRHAFRSALGRYKASRLAAIRLAQGAAPGAFRVRPAGAAEEITDYLDEPPAAGSLVARVSPDSQMALTLFGLMEVTSLPLEGLLQALRTLLIDPRPAILPLLELGLLAIAAEGDAASIDEFTGLLETEECGRVSLRIHPAVPRCVRTARPQDLLTRATGPISEIREADGLEAVLRLAALWQRVGTEPLRQTQQGVLYKRDRDRIDLDPLFAAPIADSFIPLPDSPSLWLALARRIGLIEPEPGGDRLLAASLEFWNENEFHLPQMIATAWLSLADWSELPADAIPENESVAAGGFVRCALLLWLSTLADSEWVALDDLADLLAARVPSWNRLSKSAASDNEPPPRARVSTRARPRSRNEAAAPPRDTMLLESILLGAAYPLGLVRVATEGTSRRRVVQLSPFGRSVLGLGPAPPSHPAFERFLFVQPNFEVIAYRQGLTPQVVGRLGRFAWWTQIGSALELKLSRESIVFGLDLGAKPDWMIETLSRASQRPLSRGVIEAINHWAERRERVVFYAASTLIEFLNQADRDQALELWPAGDAAPPVPVAERFLLAEDDKTVPYSRLRLTSSRDYRRPPDVCVTVEPDGVTLALDPARADLLVDAELTQFADPSPSTERAGTTSGAAFTRQFVISGNSLERGINRGVTPSWLGEWFDRRAGRATPPAVELLLLAKSPQAPTLKAESIIVLRTPTPEVLDGLRQLPATAPFLGEALGPTSAAISQEHVDSLRNVLKELGISLELE